MPWLSRWLVALAGGASALAAPLTARAQVHADVGLDAGGLLQLRSGGIGEAGPGAIVAVKAHVAVLPLVRVGAYVDEEIASTREPTLRRLTSAGARLKVTLPTSSARLRVWAFLSLGYTGAHSDGFSRSDIAAGGVTARTTAPDAGGGFFDGRIGVGGGWRLRKPWELTMELSVRGGALFTGSLYAKGGRPEQSMTATGQTAEVVGPLSSPVGSDVLACLLTVGVGLDL